MDLARFRCLPMGAPAPANAISCDGLVAGAALDLSHWVGNRTPAELKADTSTEIALNFGKSPFRERFASAPVVNNHFDTDGVLSCWAVIHPEAAWRRRELMVAAAEAGDFQEWPADQRGILVDAAFVKLGEAAGGDAAAYAKVLPQVDELLAFIGEREDLWGPVWKAITAAMAAVNASRVEASFTGSLGILRHGEGEAEVPGPVLSRLLRPRSRRHLLAFAEPGGLHRYRYELPRHAWADTVVRPVLDPPDARSLASFLGPPWRASPSVPGGTALVETDGPVPAPPDLVIRELLRADPL